MLAIQLIRSRKGITQQQLAEIMGVGQSTISMWEGGGNRPRAERLPALAGALGCSIDDLFAEVRPEDAIRWARGETLFG